MTELFTECFHENPIRIPNGQKILTNQIRRQTKIMELGIGFSWNCAVNASVFILQCFASDSDVQDKEKNWVRSKTLPDKKLFTCSHCQYWKRSHLHVHSLGFPKYLDWKHELFCTYSQFSLDLAGRSSQTDCIGHYSNLIWIRLWWITTIFGTRYHWSGWFCLSFISFLPTCGMII